MTNPEQSMTDEQRESEIEGEQRSENIPIRHVQTVPIQYEDRGDGKGRYHVGITPAIRAAGLDSDGMFRFIPEEADELGVVPALGSEEGEGHTRDSRTYSVRYTGSKEDKALRLTIPDDALAALGIELDSEAAQAGELPLLDVYVGDYMIAFDKSNAVSLSPDALPDDYEGESDGEQVVLEQAMTTVPRMRTAGTVTAALTPALKHAGSDIGAIKFHPDRADDDLVLATGHKHGDGRSGGDERSVYREGGSRTQTVPLPEGVLAALDLSPEDFEDVPRKERPALAVYAGDNNGLLAFGRPGEREVAVDRAQTPSEPAPGLTDIDGIGSKLADRLGAAGYETVEDLADATREELLAIDRLGVARADRIMADVTAREQQRGEDR
jgi:hypothetical protein